MALTCLLRNNKRKGVKCRVGGLEWYNSAEMRRPNDILKVHHASEQTQSIPVEK